MYFTSSILRTREGIEQTQAPRSFLLSKHYDVPVQKEASAFLYISQIAGYLIGNMQKRSSFSHKSGSLMFSAMLACFVLRGKKDERVWKGWVVFVTMRFAVLSTSSVLRIPWLFLSLSLCFSLCFSLSGALTALFLSPSFSV